MENTTIIFMIFIILLMILIAISWQNQSPVVKLKDSHETRIEPPSVLEDIPNDPTPPEEPIVTEKPSKSEPNKKERSQKMTKNNTPNYGIIVAQIRHVNTDYEEDHTGGSRSMDEMVQYFYTTHQQADTIIQREENPYKRRAMEIANNQWLNKKVAN